MLRFEKIKKNEERAVLAYQKILDELSQRLNRDDVTIELLAGLVKEETAHAVLAGELIRICHRNHPDVLPLNLEAGPTD